MLERTAALDALDRRWARMAYAELTFLEALARFTALWQQAAILRGDVRVDWREDLEPDLAIARAVNGLPPA